MANELLARFAGTFDITNEGYEFFLFLSSDTLTPSEAVKSYIERYGGPTEQCNWKAQIEELQTDSAEIRGEFLRWFTIPFWYFDRTLSMIQREAPLAGLIVECLQKMGASHFARIRIDSAPGERLKPLYECDWSDFLIQIPEGFLILHLGVSD